MHVPLSHDPAENHKIKKLSSVRILILLVVNQGCSFMSKLIQRLMTAIHGF